MHRLPPEERKSRPGEVDVSVFRGKVFNRVPVARGRAPDI